MAETLDELIFELQKIREEHGNLKICRYTVGTILNGVQPKTEHLTRWNDGVRRKAAYYQEWHKDKGTKGEKVLAI